MSHARSVLEEWVPVFPDEGDTTEFAVGRSFIEPPGERTDIHAGSLEKPPGPLRPDYRACCHQGISFGSWPG